MSYESTRRQLPKPTKRALIETLKITLQEALAFNRHKEVSLSPEGELV